MKKRALAAFRKALLQEAHVLESFPALTWQQLYNRLQWLVEDTKEGDLCRAIGTEFRKRAVRPSSSWFRQINRPRESGAFLRTLLADCADCAFSPDSMCLATVGKGIFQVWDTSSGQELKRFDLESAEFIQCLYFPDGTLKALSWTDKTWTVWDMEAFKETCVFSDDRGIGFVRLSPDGKYIFEVNRDNAARIRDVRTGEIRAVLAGPLQETHISGVFSSSGEEVAVIERGLIRGRLLIWDFKNNRIRVSRPLQTNLRLGLDERARCVAFSPSENRLVTGSDAGYHPHITIWDSLNGERLKTSEGFHQDEISACAYSPDGRLIATASKDKTVKLWDGENGKAIATLEGHTEPVDFCSFSPDGGLLLSSGKDKTIRLWDVGSAQTRSLPFDDELKLEVNMSVLSPDGKRAATVGEDGLVKIWDVDSGEKRRALRSWGGSGSVYSCAFSPDGRKIAAGFLEDTDPFEEHSLAVWDVDSGEKLTIQRGYKKPILFCLFSPDGESLLAGDAGGLTKLYSLENGRESWTHQPEDEFAHPCAFSPDGRTIISAGRRNTLKLWQADSGREVLELPSHPVPIEFCDFFPDGGRLISATSDGTIRFWDLRTRKPVEAFSGGFFGQVVSVLFPEKEDPKIFSFRDRQVFFWDLKSGRLEARYVLMGKVRSLSLSPQGNKACCGDEAGNAYLLRLHRSVR